MEVAHGEMVEAKLNRLIEKCSIREMDPDEREELWKASIARYNAHRQEEMRAAWASYHTGQAERHRCTLAMPRRHVPEAKLRQPDARRHMTEHLGRLAALRLGELDPEEAAAVEAVDAAFEGRLARIRGEGRR